MTDLERGELTDLLSLERGLTEWEVRFIDDLNKKDPAYLSERQAACLHRIWSRLCG